MEKVKNKYLCLCKNKSDINEHLPVLFEYSKNCTSVFETGVRGVVSSWANAYGLLNNNSEKKLLFLNDISECDISELLNKTENLNIDIKYKWCNNLDLDLKLELELELDKKFDMVFIDTWHVYGQLKRELEKFSKYANKYIIMHDTTIDAIKGETIRNKWDANKQSKETGIPVGEINKGLWFAIEEFLNLNNDWILEKRLTNNNGLTILKKIQ